MTKQDFYDFGIIMKNDSKLLFDNGRLHNSVYLGAFVLEAYIKILLIKENKNYCGHINDGKMLERLMAVNPEVLSGSILETSHTNYPVKLFSNEYDINFRYKVNRWTDLTLCQTVQEEVLKIQVALNDLRTMGIL